MGQVYYDYRDIFKAPRLALMGKNIFLMLGHLVIGYVIYASAAYVALLTGGNDFGAIWQQFGLFPIGYLDTTHLFSRLVWAVGLLVFLIMFLRGSLAVARVAFEELRGNFFFSYREALTFVSEHVRNLYRAITLVLAFVAFLVLLGIVVGLIGKIPVVGELIYGVFYDFPFFVASLFAVLVIFLLVSLLLTGPAVVAVRSDDSLSALFDAFSAVTSQPLRWVLYLGGSAVLAKVAMFVLTYFSFRALQFTNLTTHLMMGAKQADLFAAGAAGFFRTFPFTNFLTSLFPGYSLNVSSFFNLYYPGELSWSMSVGAFFIQVSMSVVAFFIISYCINTLICAQVIAFLDIRRATHQEKLAFIPEEELEQTAVTPKPEPPPARKTDPGLPADPNQGI